MATLENVNAAPHSAAVRRPNLILAICCLALLLVTMDVTIVNVALPAIGRDLHASIAGLQWSIDGYTVAYGSFLMLAGALAANTRTAEELFADSIRSFLRGAVPEVPPDAPAPRALLDRYREIRPDAAGPLPSAASAR